MRFTVYTADCTGNAGNCLYPNRKEIGSKEDLLAAIERDQVFARYRDNYRQIERFIESDVIPMDCDNDHSERPEDWFTVEKLSGLFSDVEHVIIPSRHHMLPKEGKSARPRMHILFPTHKYTDAEEYAAVKVRIQRLYPFLDKHALNAARFFFGSEPGQVVWHEGIRQIDEAIGDTEGTFESDAHERSTAEETIRQGSRNNTMSHYAGRVLKKYGVCDKAYELYLERAGKCEPPLPEAELSTIWRSAVSFFEKKIRSSDGYVPPEEYNREFGSGSLRPDDYSDIGEARVLAAQCGGSLRYTSGTDYLAFGGDRWYEDKQRSVGLIESFLDMQLSDSMEAIAAAEDALIAVGVDKATVKRGGKELTDAVPADKNGLLFTLLDAKAYIKFVMKYRNFKKIVDTQNAAKPMLAIDVSELDYDAELLNTPDGTYDLSRGLIGGHGHDPDDLITKITSCGPGEKGTELWAQTLNTFFCGDAELIDYVQKTVGMAAVGRVYAEQMIIAYGDGANGKSTFWNTIARVMGNYSGKISAEALTMSCKRNVKPEMAELKGKRLIIASELEEGTRLNTGMVKQLCSVDPIEAEKKYKDPFHFDPSHTLVLYTNHLPKVSANDEGTWRRLIVIPFNAKITGKSDIKNFSDYLFENAGPAIMKWIIEGAETAIRMDYKIPEPKAVRAAVEKYREDNDWLGQFIDEHCDIAPGYSEKSGELYQTYRNYCICSGEYVRSTSDFYGALEKAGFGKRRTAAGRLICGLRLKDGLDFLN